MAGPQTAASICRRKPTPARLQPNLPYRRPLVTGAFFALLSRHPIPESSGSDAFAAELLALLAKRGEQLTICRERIAYGH